MNVFLKKILLLYLICSTVLIATVEKANAQAASLHDSLGKMLTYFQESTKDEKILQAVKEAQAWHANNTVNDSLSAKLLHVQQLLVTASQVDRSMVFSFTEMLVQACQLLPPYKQHPDYGYSLDCLADRYENRKEYDKAISTYEQALAVKRKAWGEDHLNCAYTWNRLANLYEHTIKRDKAVHCYQQALAIIKKGKGEEHTDYAVCLNNLALVYQYAGQYEKALPIYQQALAIIKKAGGEENEQYAQALKDLATWYRTMGMHDKALALNKKALAIRKKVLGNEHVKYAQSLNSVAGIYEDKNQYDTALLYYEQALAIMKKARGENHSVYAQNLNDIGALYAKMGQYEKALALLHKALTIVKNVLGEEHPQFAIGLNMLGSLYHHLNKYDSALVFHRQALATQEKVLGKEHADCAHTLNCLSTVYSALGNDTKAAAILTQASAITLKHLTRTYSTLSEQEKTVLLNKEASLFSYLPSLLITQKAAQPLLVKQVYDHELALKGMILEDQKTVLNSIRKNKDSVALRLYEQWRINKVFLGKQLLLSTAKNTAYIDSLEETTNQLEQRLSRISASFSNQLQSQGISTKDIVQKLVKGQAAIEFLQFRLYNKKWTDSILYAAIVLRSQDTTAHFIPLCEEKQLIYLLGTPNTKDTTIEDWVIDQLYGDEKEASAKGNALYRLIWQPLEPYLDSINTIFYAPAGLLHRVAFQALPAGTARYLMDKYHLNQVLSTRSVALPVLPNLKPSTAAVWGDIEYGIKHGKGVAGGIATRGQSARENNASFFDLSTNDTRGYRAKGWDILQTEIDSLRLLFQQAGISYSFKSGMKATEEAFMAFNGNSPQLLHVATHGFSFPVRQSKLQKDDPGGQAFKMQQNPMFRSGIVLAGANRAWMSEKPISGKEDGILTAYELAQMDLSGTGLVVLSACVTALGELQGNEGTIGLQRALKLAGVKQIIVSLWKVPDKETRALMTLFYRNWLGGQTAREALRAAQVKMKREYPDKEPFNWAGFVLVE